MNDANGGEHLAGEFDLFWGMGPSRSNKSINTQHGSSSTSSNNNNSSSLRDATSSVGGGVGSMSSPADRALNPTRMGALWSHGSNLEAYGHRHHVHAQADGLMESVVGLASPPSAWRPSYDPVKQRGGGEASVASPLQHVQPQRPRVSAADAVSPPTACSVAAKALPNNVARSGSVESKLEELAAAITSSVLGKLDLGVRETIMVQQQQQQQRRHRDGVPSSYPPTSSSSSSSSSSSFAFSPCLRVVPRGLPEASGGVSGGASAREARVAAGPAEQTGPATRKHRGRQRRLPQRRLGWRWWWWRRGGCKCRRRRGRGRGRRLCRA
ncbi:unnamed protein product [Laminaria digitata]